MGYINDIYSIPMLTRSEFNPDILTSQYIRTRTSILYAYVRVYAYVVSDISLYSCKS